MRSKIAFSHPPAFNPTATTASTTPTPKSTLIRTIIDGDRVARDQERAPLFMGETLAAGPVAIKPFTAGRGPSRSALPSQGLKPSRQLAHLPRYRDPMLDLSGSVASVEDKIQAGWGDASSLCSRASTKIELCWVPVSAGGNPGGGALVPACATRRLVISPVQPGGTRREVLGSDGLLGRESAREQ